MLVGSQLIPAQSLFLGPKGNKMQDRSFVQYLAPNGERPHESPHFLLWHSFDEIPPGR